MCIRAPQGCRKRMHCFITDPTALRASPSRLNAHSPVGANDVHFLIGQAGRYSRYLARSSQSKAGPQPGHLKDQAGSGPHGADPN